MAGRKPAPFMFGLPERFSSWRPNQWESVQKILRPQSRFVIPVCPTGFGKSLVYMAAAMITSGRTCILTSTKALQDQIERDFEGIVAVIKGKQNYKCIKLGREVTCDKGACTFGVRCHFGQRGGGCEFYEALYRAQSSKIVVTNYHFWISSRRTQGGAQERIGSVDMLVCDEAHDSPETIAGLCTAEITDVGVGREVLRGYDWGNKDKVFPWIQNALKMSKDQFKFHAEQARIGNAGARKQASAWKSLIDQLSLMDELYDMQDSEENLVVSHQKDHKDRRRLRVAPIWPFDIAQKYLFQEIPICVLTSATVREKTADLLGIDKKDATIFEYDHAFPVLNRRTMHLDVLPQVRVNRHADAMVMRFWVQRGDRIIREYQGYKGIWHTVSYYRQKLVTDTSTNKDRLVSHSREDADHRIRLFKKLTRDSVLVSPRVTTGYDFPGDECRFQIVGKIPYPDTRDDIMRARCKVDKNYAPYHAMQTLVQTTGRGTRSADDWCDTWIIDDNAKWFVRKYSKFAPRYFVDAFGSVGKVFLIDR